MAVRAHEDALGRLLPQNVERACEAAPSELKAFGGGIEVVELQRGEALVVPAAAAAPTCLGDEDLLRTAPPAGYRGGSAPTACARSVAPDDMQRLPVGWAHRRDPRMAGGPI